MNGRVGKFIVKFSIFIIIVIIIFFVVNYLVNWQQKKEVRAQKVAIENFLEERIQAKLAIDNEKDVDLFGEDQILRILFLGLDSRAGQASAHCDAIQFIEINKNLKNIKITAVPRGTYSTLPPGTGKIASDYYLANACGFGGIEYGVEQIEKVLGKKADYLVMVGFSETMGILSKLKLPTTETLQWLRHRQGYAIGEPQRAHNHSTFIKQMLVKHVPAEISTIDKTLHYLIYKLVQTDLSFAEIEVIVNNLVAFDLKNNPQKIQLGIWPPHEVQNINYDPENLDKYLKMMIEPIKHLLDPKDYADITQENSQKRIIDLINSQQDNLEFVEWAFKNKLWYQIENEQIRLESQYNLMFKYLSELESLDFKKEILSNYVLEMDYLKKDYWRDLGKSLLADLIVE